MREEEIGEEVVDETQIKTLDKILSEKVKEDITIKIPKDEFNDEALSGIEGGFSSGGSGGSISSEGFNNKMIKRYGYTFNIGGFESNSIAYFKEILLGRRTSDKSKCYNVKFNFENENFFKIGKYYKCIMKYLEMIVNADFDLQGDIDGIITNVDNEVIQKAKLDNPYNIFTSNNFLMRNKKYDIFCESTFGLIDKLSIEKEEKISSKVIQLKKLIFLIDFIKKINNEINEDSKQVEKNMKTKINQMFHHADSNDIMLCIIVDGNYKQLIQQIKNSCLFEKKWNNKNESGMMKNLFEYFRILRESKMPFLIVYMPRFYERKSQYYNPITKIYLEDKKKETVQNINKSGDDNENQQDRIQKLEQKIKELQNEIDELKSGNFLLGKKTQRSEVKEKKLEIKKKEDDKNDE